MKKYIFYTTEGFTQAPDGEDIENCQLLGCASGQDKQEAMDNLLKETFLHNRSFGWTTTWGVFKLAEGNWIEIQFHSTCHSTFTLEIVTRMNALRVVGVIEEERGAWSK